MISSDDALLLLKKWNTEKSPIHVLMALSFGTASVSGVVQDVDAASLSIRIVGLDSRSEFTFNLENSEFNYADPREAREELKHEATQYEGTLAVTTPSRDGISFFELRAKI